MFLKIFKSHKFKSVSLLLGMVLYCLGLVFYFGFDYEIEKFENPEGSRESDVLMSNFNYERLEEVEDNIENYYEEDEELVDASSIDMDEDGDVLGASSSMGGSCEPTEFGLDEPQFFCSDLDVSASYDTESYLSSEARPDARVELTEVYAPSALFAGSEMPFDNLLQTTNPKGAVSFRNANEMVIPLEYLTRQAPLDNVLPDGMDRVDGGLDGDHEHFEMHAQVSQSFGDSDGIGKTAMDTAPGDISICPDTVNDGRSNVEKSNELGQRATKSVTPPGLMEGLDERRENYEFCQKPPRRTINLNKEESFLLCSPEWFEEVLGFMNEALAVSFEYSLFKYDEAPDIAKKSMQFEGVVIDSPLGSANACESEACGIRYAESGRLLSSPPTMTGDMTPSGNGNDDYIVEDPMYLTTPCRVDIDDKSVDTKCFWDLSAWQHIFALEENFTYPGHEKKYSEEEYWWLVEQELKGEEVSNVSATLDWLNNPANPENPANVASGQDGHQDVDMKDPSKYIEEAKASLGEDVFEARVDQLRDYIQDQESSSAIKRSIPFADRDDLHELIVALSEEFQGTVNGNNVQLDYRLTYAIARHESLLGTEGYVRSKGQHNAWGWGIHEGYSYNNWEEGIYAFSRGLFRGYYISRDVSNGGHAPDSELVRNIQRSYAPTAGVGSWERGMNQSWIEGVEHSLNNIGPKIE